MNNKMLGVAEILKKISDLPDPADRQNSLATCAANTVLIGTLQCIFDPRVEFDLPDGAPPYNENQFLDQTSNYYKEFRKMYLFLKGNSLKPLKRETLFVQFLETISKDDAKMVVGMKDKTSIFPNITYELVQSTFPDLLPEKPKEEKKINKSVETKKKEQKSRNTDLDRPCPFGCKNGSGGDMFQPSSLVIHLKSKHKMDEKQIIEFKELNY